MQLIIVYRVIRITPGYFFSFRFDSQCAAAIGSSASGLVPVAKMKLQSRLSYKHGASVHPSEGPEPNLMTRMPNAKLQNRKGNNVEGDPMVQEPVPDADENVSKH